MRPTPGNDLVLGQLAGRRATLGFSRTERDKHLYCCGGTGTGKSKFLESLIRQDIRQWHRSRCGLILLDPHGSLYDSIMQWLAWEPHAFRELPIVPIDLRRDDWIVSYNLLRQRELADPAVLVDNLTDAMAYVWGQGGTNQTPLFARWAGNVLRALYEKKLTLVEAEHLVDRVAKQTRYAMTADLKDRPSRQDWQFADTLNAKDFEAQIGSTVNRLQRFIRNQTMRSIFGQPEVSLDLGQALEEGSIILVSLATERAKVSKENAELFATLLLSDLWTAAQERGKRDGVKPYYCYLDEFQRFISPTISDNLDEARGFGLHFTMAHQFPNQLLDRGENGKRVYNSIMENASSKVVFRLSHEENLRAMAQWLFMGVMNPDEVKHELYSTMRGTVSFLYSQGVRTNLTLTEPGVSWTQSYGYDSAWRMTSVTSPAGTFGYNYNFDPASALVSSISLPNGANITNIYDSLARLQQTSLYNHWGHALDGETYGLDALGLRTNILRNLGLMSSSVNVGYDNIGQLISWFAKEANGTPRLNEQLSFGFDQADNFAFRTNGTLSQTFTADSANELTSVTRTGNLTFSGAMPAPATKITVNGQTAQTNGDFTFAVTNLALSNGNNSFTGIAQNIYGFAITNTTTVNLPQNVNLAYDDNGNLTNDGTRTFFYNTENQLTNVFVPDQWREDFVYDGLGRRRIVRDFAWQSGWFETDEVRIVYDGYLPIQERDTNNNVMVTYTRGLDVSGSLEGAGGIGGLLARTDTNGSTYYHSDSAGNITALMDGNEDIVARYMYGPFGKLTGEWGPMAGANEMQFSSMPHDNLSSLSFYPFRAYEPNFQRWLNRDPIQELGGLNLYGFVGNNPINHTDPLGLSTYFDENYGDVSSYQNPANLPVVGAYVGAGVAAGAAVTGVGLAVDAYGASVLAWLGLGAAAAETPEGQEEMQEAEQLVDQAAATAPSTCDKAALIKAAQNALGKGSLGNPGAPLTPQMIAGLQQNAAAAQNTLSLAQQGLNTAGNPISTAQAQAVIQAMQNRLNTIQQVIQSGVQAPRN